MDSITHLIAFGFGAVVAAGTAIFTKKTEGKVNNLTTFLCGVAGVVLTYLIAYVTESDLI